MCGESLLGVVATMGYRTFEHTADIGIEAWADDLPRAYEQAARALFSVMVDVDKIDERTERLLRIQASDREALLVAWLNELIGLVDAEGLVFRRSVIDPMTETELVARCFGEALDPARHAPRTAVKAATFHGLSVEPGPPARVRVILDL